MVESSGELTAHLTTGAVVVYFIELLKKSRWATVLTPDTRALNRIASAMLAAVASFGINWSYDPVVGQLVVTGLTWSMIMMSAWEFLKQFVVQQLIFDGVVAKKTNGRA